MAAARHRLIVTIPALLIVVLVGSTEALALTATAQTFNKDSSNAALSATVTFQGNATGLPAGTSIDDVSWSWNFGDGGTSTLRNPTHEFNTGGVKTVTLTATVEDEATDDDTCIVNVVASLIIDEVESRPSNKISFNNKCEVKGHVMPRDVSGLDAKLDWEMNKIAYADCNLKNSANGNLQWAANWPTQNSRWSEADEALVVSLDRKADQDADLDTALNDGSIDAHKASIDCQKYYSATTSENPTDDPNWFYYYKNYEGNTDYVYDGTLGTSESLSGVPGSIKIANNAHTGGWYWTHDYANPGGG